MEEQNCKKIGLVSSKIRCSLHVTWSSRTKLILRRILVSPLESWMWRVEGTRKVGKIFDSFETLDKR